MNERVFSLSTYFNLGVNTAKRHFIEQKMINYSNCNKSSKVSLKFGIFYKENIYFFSDGVILPL